MRLGTLFARMRALPKPVVAVVHGRALAGGAGLVTACDLVLAGAGVQIGYPEIQRGFVPAMVMTLLRRAVGEKPALDLVLTGRVLTADEAHALGLVGRVVPDEALEREADVVDGRARGGERVGARADQAALLSARRPKRGRRDRARRPGQRRRAADPGLPGRHRAVPPAVTVRVTAAFWARLRRVLALAGFALAALAVAYEDRRIGWGAIGLLAVSLLMRLLSRRDGSTEPPNE